MEKLTGRLKHEHQTVVLMTAIYCEDHHAGKPADGLCDSCAELMSYSEQRLAKCPYGQQKPTCAKCPVHCYKKEPRENLGSVFDSCSEFYAIVTLQHGFEIGCVKKLHCYEKGPPISSLNVEFYHVGVRHLRKQFGFSPESVNYVSISKMRRLQELRCVPSTNSETI